MVETVTHWLEQLGLGQYATAFAENDIDLDVLQELDHETLKDIGVNSAGHRLRIIKAARAIRVSASGTNLSAAPSREPAELPASSGVAERRQLTVMFCDLVGSTELSTKLDPEDLREINRAYQDACKAAIERYDGYVARYMGDGVLAYFGYPQAHEDDAERAIQAGLDVVEKIGGLNPAGAQDKNVELGVRVGIATGPVVVGDLIGEGASQESAVVGETPNLAARLQGFATKNTVVISAATQALAGERFKYEELGAQSLKDISEPVHPRRVVAALAAESRFEAAHRTKLTPLVGREHETGLLLDRWAQAKEGDGQAVLLSGEAGIGKSRITEALRERTAADKPARLRYQCSPYHTNSALHPVIEQLERAARFEVDDLPEVKLDKLESLLARAALDVQAVAPLFAPLMSIPSGGRYPALEITPERQKEQTLEALVAQMEGLSRSRPVLFIFEDVHWADPTSLELLEIAIGRVQTIPTLIVLTYRPEFSPPWSGHTHVTSLTLNRFTRGLATAMVEGVTGGKALPDEVLDQIIEKTDGVPLFVEELTKTILESGLLTEESKQFVANGPLRKLAIPATLHDSLMARLDRLGAVKEVAQTASVIGREFDFDLLAFVSPISFESLRDGLVQLMDAGLVFRRGRSEEGCYIFKHALVQDAAYGSLLKSKRQDLHGRIAAALLKRFPETTAAQPELLAHHYTEAGKKIEAVTYWLQAGRRATERSANQESVRHLENGLAIVQTLPASIERARQELSLHSALYTPFLAAKGYTSEEIPTICARSRELCELTGETDELFPALYAQWAHYFVSGNYLAGRTAAQELLALAEASREPPAMAQGNRLLGWTDLILGDLPGAALHLHKAVELYDARKGRSLALRYAHNPYVAALSAIAIRQLLTGFPEQALHSGKEAIDHGRELGHAASLCYGLTFGGAQLAAIAHEPRAALAHSRACIALGREQSIASFLAWNKVIEGWATAKLGKPEEGMVLLTEGLEDLDRSGQGVFRSFYLSLLAEVCMSTGDLAAARSTLATAMAVIKDTGERWYEADVNRLLGEVHVGMQAPSQGEAQFRRAAEIARELGEKSLELRAATSLACLWRRQGKHNEARNLLAPIYDWFTEGFDGADLKDAKTTLDRLA